MKYLNFKLLTFILTALLAFDVGWAGTVTFDLSTAATTNGTKITSLAQDGVTLTFVKGSGNDAAWYSGTVRIYQGGTLEVNSPNHKITGIVFIGGNVASDTNKGGLGKFTASSGTYTVTKTTAPNEASWSGSINYVEFSVPSTSSAQVWLAQIVVTTEDGGDSGKTDVDLAFSSSTATATLGESFTAPTLSVNPSAASSAVAYSSSNTSVATVASDGTVTPVAAGTTTITASISNNATYNDASASYTLTVEAGSQPGGYYYEKVTSNTDLTSGEYLIVCESKSKVFNGSLSNLSSNNGQNIDVTIANDRIASNSVVDAATFTIDITAGSIYSKSGYYIGRTTNDNGLDTNANNPYSNTISIDASGNAIIASSAKPTLRYNASSNNSLFRYYKTTTTNMTAIQLFKKVSGGSTVERVATPTFSPAGGAFDEPQYVTISCETPSSTIYYTTDGSTPDENSTLYTGTITVDHTMTIKAIAVASGMDNSLVASAAYTLPVFVTNLAGANALGTNVSFKYTGYAEVTYVNGTDAWIRDDAGTGGYLYRAIPSGSSFANGHVLKAGWTATKDEFKGLVEFKDVSGLESNSTATVEPEVLTRITDADINKYVKLVNVSASEIVDGSGNAVQLYDKFGTNYTFESGKKYDVIGIVGYYNNLQLHIISITEHGEPKIAVTPTALTLKEDAQTFTVTGENLIDNVGVPNVNNVFNITYTGDADWGFVKDAQGKVNGTVTVTYTGRELKATDTFVAGTKKSWNPVEEISIPVTVTYQPDIYIVGNINNAGWNFGDGNRPMSYDEATGLYTAQLTTTGHSYFMFARKPGQNYGWQGDQNRLFFGAQTEGGNWVLGTEPTGNIDVYGTTGNQYHPIELPSAGEYTITVNPNPTAKTFTITKVVHQVETPVISPESGNYNTIQTVTITCATEGAAIHYTIDGSEPTESSATYEDPITVDKTMTIKAIAVMDGMDNSEVAEATYTLPTSVKTLAAANELVKDTEFLFTGDAVVTYHNGDYTFLRDVNATAGGGLIYQSGINLAQGVVLKKGWDAKRDDYRGEKEYINAINVENSGTTADFTPFDRTGVAFDDTHMNEYVTFNNVTITGKELDQNSGKYTYTGTYTDGNRANVDYILHNQFDLNNIEEGRTYNVTGVVTKRDDNMQVYPTAVTLVQQDPNMSFAEETVNATFGAEFTEPELTKPEGVTVKYSSENTEVAEVNETTGEVTIKKIGNAKITATSVENDYYTVGTASYNIVVSAGTPTFAYSAETKEVVFGTENPELPTLNNPNSLTVTYTSSKPAVATVNTQGEVTIVGAGTTTITATGAATGNYGAATASYELTVAQGAAGLSYPEGTSVTATVGDNNVVKPTLNNPNELPVTWSSDNESVATVDAEGNVTIVGPGTAHITATYTAGEDSNYATGSATYTITVNDVVVALAAPTFAPAAGTYTEPKEVAIACATPGVTIEYTIDGVTKT